MTTTNTKWFDFNHAPDVSLTPSPEIDTDELKARLLSRVEHVLAFLFPAGKVRGKQFVIGDVLGHSGKSLSVELDGARAGMWLDFATSEGGDIFALWARVKGLDVQREFPRVKDSITQWLGCVPLHLSTTTRRQAPVDELGPATAKWDYRDAHGKLIACVYRYETEDGKEFRPWDVRARAMRAPEPRPLYNQPQIHSAQYVVLVEGEKCADALTQLGIVATTAMNGANAPVDKTDWSPLTNKHVLIWPDNDEAGRQYAQGAAHKIATSGALSVAIVQVPFNKPEKWDAFDAVAEKVDVQTLLREWPRINVQAFNAQPVFSFDDLFKDNSPMPEDLIGPRVLTPGGLIVLGGAPKVGKSDFLLSWLTHMAAGESFLGLHPSRPLRVFYLQAEMQYHYLRERVQSMRLPEHVRRGAGHNLYLTPQLHLTLDDSGFNTVLAAMQRVAAEGPIDILAIDPLRNVFYGGPNSNGENDNESMLYFLRERVEKLRNAINPKAGIILAHHTKKLAKKQLEDDPFLALSGASSLRGYYTTGMLLHRPDELVSERALVFELRNGSVVATKRIDKENGQWIELARHNERLVNKERGAKHDAERSRQRSAIERLIFDEAAQGRVYTPAQFAHHFESQKGLGSNRSIKERISVMASKGYIRFFREHLALLNCDLKRSKYGYMCVEGMLFRAAEHINTDNGEITYTTVSIQPTHYKCPHSGVMLSVDDPDVWGNDEDLKCEQN